MSFPDKIELTINEADINNGVRCCAFGCPVSKAANRVFGSEYDVAVNPGRMPGSWELSVYNPNLRFPLVVYEIPSEDGRLINDYDYGATFMLRKTTLTKVEQQ